MSEISPALRDHLNTLAARAAKKGAPLWDVLNAAGLLFTEDLRRCQRTHALTATITWLEGLSVPALIGDAYMEGRSTAKDMRVGITERLRERADLAREGKA